MHPSFQDTIANERGSNVCMGFLLKANIFLSKNPVADRIKAFALVTWHFIAPSYCTRRQFMHIHHHFWLIQQELSRWKSSFLPQEGMQRSSHYVM